MGRAGPVRNKIFFHLKFQKTRLPSTLPSSGEFASARSARISIGIVTLRAILRTRASMADATKHLVGNSPHDYDIVVKALGRMTRDIGDHGDGAITKSARAFVHSASSLAEKIKKRSANLAKKAGEEVNEHPIATAALAAAAFGLVGYAVTHSSKPK